MISSGIFNQLVRGRHRRFKQRVPSAIDLIRTGDPNPNANQLIKLT